METEVAATAASKRAEATERIESGETSTLLPQELHLPLPPPPMDGSSRVPSRSYKRAGSIRHPKPPSGAGRGEEGDGDGVDRISHLPDDILGEIVSFLPTKDAARTQTLASRWRRIWHSVPLNLDHSDLHCGGEALANLISRILASRRGPARRLSFPAHHLHRCPATVDAWLRSPALNGLQELELDVGGPLFSLARDVPLPGSAFRFWATLRVAIIRHCRVPDGAVDALRFPQLRQLGLDDVEISEGSLHSIIAGCPVLECLLLRGWCRFRCLRINSPSLVSIGLSVYCGELIIENAPSLERLLQLEFRTATIVSVVSAPKLETLGCLSDFYARYNTYGTIVLQESRSVMTMVSSVKILAINIRSLSMDMVINLMRCFPCLETLYIQTQEVSESENLCHRDAIGSLGIGLKKVVLRKYQGTISQVKLATFFVLNARVLELMRFEVEACKAKKFKKFVGEQHRLLQLEKRASRDAQFYFKNSRCDHYIPLILHVHDLSKTDLFVCDLACGR